MKQTEEAIAAYKNAFPSDIFLQTHFGENVLVEGNPHRGEISEELYSGLRHLFDSVLLGLPIRMLKHMNRTKAEFEPVSVFKDGQPAEWVDPALESQGLMIELPPDAFLELCREFIIYCQTSVFGQHTWWQWHTDNDSIWVEVIPAAIKAGKNKPRSLAEILGTAHK